jgi:ribosomal protein L40E
MELQVSITHHTTESIVAKQARPAPLITLENPVSHNFATFIMGNSQHCTGVVEENSHKGKSLVICGAGPTLRDTAPQEIPKADVVWGCNSAGPWLLKEGYKVDAFFTVDQTSEMLAEWSTVPDVEYLVASSVHPHLIELLMMHDRRFTMFHNYVGIRPDSVCEDCSTVGVYRATKCPACGSANVLSRHGPVAYSVCFDCNADGKFRAEKCEKCGSTNVESNYLEYEDYMYASLYPSTIRAGSGLNTVNRAIDVANFMGFDSITVLGADCCLKVKRPMPNAPHGSPEHMKWLEEETIMHADGGSALASGQSPLTMSAVIDPGTPDARVRRGKGRHFETKVDLVVSAVWLTQMEKHLKGKLRLVGDTLPVALRKKNNAYLMRLPTLNGMENTLPFVK